MTSLERLLRGVGLVALACGVVVGVYGYVLANVDVVAMLAGAFVAFVGAAVFAAGVVLPRLDGPNGRRA